MNISSQQLAGSNNKTRTPSQTSPLLEIRAPDRPEAAFLLFGNYVTVIIPIILLIINI